MNLGGVLFLLGRLLLGLAVALLVPASLAWAEAEPELAAFLYSAGIACVSGIVLQARFRQAADFRFGHREAFVLVSTAWFTASIVGALPYLLIHGVGFAVDALFESASGFTTTGASVITNIEGQARSLLLWRSLTQWLGGMGIIVLGIAILPKLAVGGMELLGAEAPGPMQEKLTPRIAQTAKLLWFIYALFTALAAAAYALAGMTVYDAVNHAFTTLACAGFSTKNASVEAFHSATIDGLVTFFMLVGGANFALHYHLLRGRPGPMLRDPEWRYYLGMWGIAALAISADLWIHGIVGSIGDAVRFATFQSATVLTTTGYSSTNFDTWPAFSKAVLFLMFFAGGCAGSTAGGVKVVRIRILLKKIVADLRRRVNPHAVIPVRLGDRAIPDTVVSSVTTFFVLYLTLFAAGGLFLTLMGMDLVSGYSAAASALGNIGPGFGEVGPAANYAPLPAASKLVLAGLMIAGRLEIYPVLLLLFLGRRRLARFGGPRR